MITMTNTATDADQVSHERLLEDWLAIWNGDYAPADRLISPAFFVHAAMLDGSDSAAIRGPEGLVGWVAQLRAAFTELVFEVEVGPILDANYLALRWIATGKYGGGFPGATAAPGAEIQFTGTDLLRVEHEMLAEYWLNSDVHVLLAQLGLR
jgi:hypothetical protein